MFGLKLKMKRFKLSLDAFQEFLKAEYPIPQGVDPYNDPSPSAFYYVGLTSSGDETTDTQVGLLNLMFSSEMETILNKWNSYGKARLVANGAGPNLTLDADVDYDVQPGDVVVKVNDRANPRAIQNVTNRRTFVLAGAFPANPSDEDVEVMSPEIFYNFNSSDKQQDRLALIERAKTDAAGKDWATDPLTVQQRKLLMGQGLNFNDWKQLAVDFPEV